MNKDISKLLKNPYRVMIIRVIGYEGASFTEIREATKLSTGTIYHHIYTMRELIYKEGKKYKLTKLGQRVLEELEKGTFNFNKFSKRELRLGILLNTLLLLGVYKILLRSLILYPIAIFLLILDLYLSLQFDIGLILLRPILFPQLNPAVTTLLSILVIIGLNLIVILISTGLYYSKREILNMCIIQIIPISLIYVIPLLYIIFNLNIAILNTIIQFIIAILLASAVSVSSGLTVDRALAISAFILFISQII